MKRIVTNSSNYWTYAVCALLIAAAGIAFQVGAQSPTTPTNGTIGGFAPLKPKLSMGEGRPLESPERPVNTGRGEDNGSISSFVETLQGTDSAFQIVLGQSRMFTTREPIAKDGGVAAIAVSDPTILEFEVMPNPRMIRLTGRRAGVTDLSFTTSDSKTYSFEVHVTYDLDLLRAQMKQVFPEAYIKLGQMREHLVVEGQARSTDQMARILQVLEGYLVSMQVRSQDGNNQANRGAPGGGGADEGGPEAGPGAGNANPDGAAAPNSPDGATDPNDPNAPPADPLMPAAPQNPAADDPQGPVVGRDGMAVSAMTGRSASRVTVPRPQIINLMTVPGVQQVMLQVQIAELNRTALREIGVDWLLNTPNATLGTQIAGATAGASNTGGGLLGLGPTTTGFAIFPSGELAFMIRALRRNSVLNVLAEPNLVALHGQEASFLAGGEFPVPVPQAGNGTPVITIQYKQFGVLLNFIPYILDDETIRLRVAPEASSIDESIGTEVAGSRVPGISTRRINTSVEMKQGQTLALAGLLQVAMDGQTSRIPLLGDLPYIGTMFSNTTHRRQEKELVVLVTPHLIKPMNPGEVPALPGDDVHAPNDLEFYLLNRIEGRTARPHRPTTSWDNALGFVQLMKLEQSHVVGPSGYSVDEEE